MQYRQPMHRLESMSTTPSSVAKVAPTGQTWTHGGCTQWLQSLGTKNVLSTSGSSCDDSFEAFPLTLMLSTTTSPSFLITYRSIHVRKKNASCVTSFSALHASTHRLQPMHLSISMPMP